MKSDKMQPKAIIQSAYEAFNRRDIDAVLQLMAPNVEWPNGWEGGYVHGHEQVRDYWTRQWKELNPRVTPVSMAERADEQIEVEVHQYVKDIEGAVVFDGTVKHLYTFENEFIRRMEITEL